MKIAIKYFESMRYESIATVGNTIQTVNSPMSIIFN